MRGGRSPTAADLAAMAAQAALDDAIEAAWDAKTDAARAKAARKVLALDPDALDGYVILHYALTTDAEKLALLFEAVRRGRRIWAAAIKRPSAHDFWVDFETRPFLRALHLLALNLWSSGERAEAVREAEALLRLNPNDNQGIRAVLLAWYPVIDAWDGFEKILKRYRDDGSTEFAYARCLAAIRAGTDLAALLAEAIKTNPHVPARLRNPEKPVKPGDVRFAGFVEFGSDAEAASYVEAHLAAWQAVPGALDAIHKLAVEKR